ncbi:uncharacterized protein TRUGW13939_02296 [Talaromyces rugulosus]|uniref:Cytochrome P450 n=1 Tax=Talaromyces rugulosus TaxID=121627 RepID=A0A7H8QMS8_TALRU|nr:uncharacterized protein TRUGW13939_02296 [Talaromyces rugulosus]QKX55204.1 hypothetical protein TRUGW13939_02296 [Talaromyces rugulosus]
MSTQQYIVFSSSLRHRSVWSVLSPVFEAADITLEESLVNTHDLEFHLPDQDISLRAILVTPSCLEDASRQVTLTRAEQFATVNSSRVKNSHLAIVFLLSDKAFQTARGRYRADGLVSLQALIFQSQSASGLPIIPAAEPSTVLASVQEHCNALARGPISHPSFPPPSPLSLLEYVVTSGPSQLPAKHNLNVLSDLFPSLRALSRAATTPDGRQLIVDYLGEDLADSIQAFWEQEWNLESGTMLNYIHIFFLGFAAVLGLVVYRRRSHDAQEPPLVTSSIPIFGHLIGSLWYGIPYFGKQAEKYSMYPMISLDLIVVKIYVISSPSLMRSVQQNSKALSFDPFIEFSARRMAGLPASTIDLLKSKQASGNSLFSDILHGMSPTLLGEPLDRMNERMIRLLRPFIDGFGSSTSETIDLYEWIRHAVTLASTDSSYGDMNPYKDRKIEDSFWDFESYLSPLIANVLPWLTARPAWKGREKLANALEDYYHKGGHENSSELTLARFKIPRDAGITLRDIARLEATMAFGLLSNTVPAAFWVLFDIISRDKLLEEIREEVRQNALHILEDGTHMIDLADLRDDCPLLISTFQEILRKRTSTSPTRFVTKEVMVGDRYLLKEGNVVMMPAISIGRKPDVWGSTHDDFDARRFMKTTTTASENQTEGKKDPRRVGGFMTFGVSPVICPGRHFASGEILGLIAMTALRFNLLPVGGIWKGPKTNAMAIASIMNPLKEPFHVNVRPRKAFEGKRWDFSVTEGKSKYPLVIG